MPNNSNVKPARKNNAWGNNSKAKRNGNLARANGNAAKANNNAKRANNAARATSNALRTAANSVNANANTAKVNANAARANANAARANANAKARANTSTRKRHNARGWYKGGKRGVQTTSGLRRTTGLAYDASYFGSVAGLGLGGLTAFVSDLGVKTWLDQPGTWLPNTKKRVNGFANLGVGLTSLLVAPMLPMGVRSFATGVAGTALAFGVVELVSSFVKTNEEAAIKQQEKATADLTKVMQQTVDPAALVAATKQAANEVQAATENMMSGVGGPNLSELLLGNDEAALEADHEARVSNRLDAVEQAYNGLLDDLDQADVGDPGYDDVVVLDTIEHHLAQMRFAMQNADVAFEQGDLAAADAFATVAVQQGVAAEEILNPLLASSSVADVINAVIPDNATAMANAAANNAAVAGYPIEIPVANARVEGDLMVSAPHPDQVFGPGMSVGSRTIDFDILNAWAQDASGRINQQISAQPGQPGYTTPEQMALAYLYWFDLYTNRRGYIYGLQQMQAQAPGSWQGSGWGDPSVSGANPAFATSAMPTFLTVRGQAVPCGMGTGQELASVVHQLYGGQ